MIAGLLLVIGIILCLTTGIGYILINVVILGIIEIIAALFTGLIGFIILGLLISWILSSFNKHS